MWITKVSIKNPVFATMVMVGLCVLGLFAYARLGVEGMPNVTTPTVSIEVLYPGASPEAVENDVTKPIENAVNTVSGIKRIRSTSSEGQSSTYIEFTLGTDVNRVVQDVRDKIAQVRPTFPREAKDPLVIRADNERDQPVMSLSVISTTRDQRELTSLTEQTIVKRLQEAQGVGRVAVSGGTKRQVVISIHPQELAAFGIGVDQVIAAIKAANQDIAAGLIANSKTEQMVRIEGRITDVSGFRHLIVARRGSAGAEAPVYLDQVAEVRDGQGEPEAIARLNGKPSISLDVYKTQDANAVETGHAIKRAITDLNKDLPPGVQVQLLYANSDFVEEQLSGVKETLIEGGLLTVLIVFLFLRSWRSTIITGLTLPIAVISSFIAMFAFGFTLNMMTMMALSLCIGLLIDDAIVVRENIVRHLRMGKSHHAAAAEGTEEIGLAVMATTFAIVAVFVPVAFMSGIIGKFFFAFGVTVAVAVMVSLFVSFTLDPMLSSVWQDDAHSGILRFAAVRALLDRVEHVIEYLHRVYDSVLRWSLVHRIKTLLAAGILFVGSLVGLVVFVGGEFVPQVDEGWISVHLTLPVGSSLEYADGKARQVEAELRNIPEIEDMAVDVYGQGRGTVEVDLKLVDHHKRKLSQQDLEKVVRNQLAHVAGIRTTLGWGSKIWIDVIGSDVEKLNATALALADDIRKIKGVVDLDTSLRPGTPALAVRPNREAASDLGLTTQTIGDVLQPLFGGQTVGYWLGPDAQNYEVHVQLPKSERTAAADIGDLLVTTNKLGPDGTPRLVPLRQVTTIASVDSPQVIKRGELKRRIGIYANFEGRPGGDIGTDIKAAIAKRSLPPGISVSMNGEQEEMDDFVGALLGALTLAVIFIYLVLASQFGSFLQPIAIMFSLPLAIIGVFIALLVTGSTVNVFSMIGLVMLMGLVTKNAILLVDFANQGQRNGLSQFESLLNAGQVRLRPIMMTTTAMVFGMLPLAAGWGGVGAAQEAPMGRAIIGGVITSTLLTLIVVPVIYSYLDRWGKNFTAWYQRRTELRLAQSEGIAAGGQSPHDKPQAPAPGLHATPDPTRGR